jgi:hypothetical protein
MKWVSAARVKLRSLLLTALIPCAIHRQQIPAKQVELTTEQYKFSVHVAGGIAVVAPEVSDRLEVRLQVPQQPDYLDIAVSFSSNRWLDRTRFR